MRGVTWSLDARVLVRPARTFQAIAATVRTIEPGGRSHLWIALRRFGLRSLRGRRDMVTGAKQSKRHASAPARPLEAGTIS